MANAPTVTIPGPLSSSASPHVSGLASINTYISQLQNTGNPIGMAAAAALLQLSNGMSKIVKSLTQNGSFTFNTPVAYTAAPTSTITLTSSFQVVPGDTLTLPTTGQYLLISVLGGTATSTISGISYKMLAGSTQIGTASTSETGFYNLPMFVVYQATAGDVISIQAFATGSGGSSATVIMSDTYLIAIWLHGASNLPATPVSGTKPQGL